MADVYTDGDFILHLDSDVVVFEDITYAHMFHLGKAVLPFRRYEVDTFGGEISKAAVAQAGICSYICLPELGRYSEWRVAGG